MYTALQERDILLINYSYGDWKPTIKDQSHKHVLLHFIPTLTQTPLCDHSRTPCDLTPNRITKYCAECQKLLNNLSNGILRKCKVCGYEAHTEKDLERFRPDTSMVFGRTNTCLKCSSNYNYEYSQTNNEKIASDRKRRYLKNPDYYKNWKSFGKNGAAHMMAQRKVREITECCICKKTKNLVRHHPDYNKPKDVIIVCKSCHAKIHSKRIPVILTIMADGTAHLVDQEATP